jgi:hypothetical protein
MSTATADADTTKAADATDTTKAADPTKAADTTDTSKAADATADGKAATGTAADGTATTEGAPATYALTNPDADYFDATDMETFASVAKANAWTAQQAQEAVANHLEGLKAQSEAFLKRTTEDKDLGGAHLEQTQLLARKGLDRVAPKGTPHGDEARALLRKTGYENHPAIVRMFRTIGDAMSEDGRVAGQTAESTTERKRTADILFDPNQKSE